MAIALPILFQLFEPVQAAVQWLSGASSASTAGTASSGSRAGHASAFTRPACASAVRPADQRPVPQRAWRGPLRMDSAGRPLRVLRVVESRTAPTSAGRMVISGRMADVCAELDRLAELETRH